jgi:transposase
MLRGGSTRDAGPDSLLDEMRGADDKQACMFSVVSPEKRVPAEHPLRPIKAMVEAALKELSPVFDVMYSDWGRPSISPERLLKSSLLIALYSVRSERQFCEQLDYNLLFRWFLDLSMDAPGFDASTFSKNRDRLLAHDVAKRFFAAVVGQARDAGLLSAEHFTVDGTLIEAWASLKSFRPKDEEPGDRPPPDDKGNPTVNFHGEKRSNATHASTTDPEAKLARKGDAMAAKLSYSAHALMENRNGLLVDFRVDEANGTAERTVAAEMLHDNVYPRRATVGADKGYDTRDFVSDCRLMNVTPHVAPNEGKHRRSAIDWRTRGQPGYTVSQRKRKLVEEVFGWLKTVAGFRRTRYRGLRLTQLAGHMAAAAYNLLRMAKLGAVCA